ncbi:YbaN family protein [Paracoccaceae bacterium GXU_MW_L88]
MTFRLFWLLIGWLAVALGTLGIVLPLLPTTVFFILAAFAFGKSSPELRARLMNHPRIGPPLRDWEARGAISPAAKRASILAMLATLLISWALGASGTVLLIQTLCLSAVALFILTRPS